MDLDKEAETARHWVSINRPNFQLKSVDKTQDRIYLKCDNTEEMFYIHCWNEDGNTKRNVWSDNDDVASKLQMAIDGNTSAASIEDWLQRCVEVLGKEYKTFDDDPDDDDIDDDNYYDQPEDFEIEEEEKKPVVEDSEDELIAEGKNYGSSPAIMVAIHRLNKDLKNIIKVGPTHGIEASPQGDSLFVWDIKLHFPKECRLHTDLVNYNKKYNEEAALKLEVQFPGDYPYSPPFVRIVKPRLKVLTGHVTVGGSICMELLTKTGWTASYDIESIMISVRSDIMSDPNVTLDKSSPNEPYEEVEARRAFHRMIERYGWKMT